MLILIITNNSLRRPFKNPVFFKVYSLYFEVYPEADSTVSVEEIISLFQKAKVHNTISKH